MSSPDEKYLEEQVRIGEAFRRDLMNASPGAAIAIPAGLAPDVGLSIMHQVARDRAPTPLKLEAGKFYRSRDGRKFGPVRYRGNCTYPWDQDDDTGESWTDDGVFYLGRVSAGDLVAEWVDDAEDEVLYASPSRGCCNAASTRPIPERVKILHDGASLTNGDRDDEYGPPANNMTCAGELKAVFRKWLARDISPGELEALDMAMTKLSRLSCGKPKRDTYVDAATYIAIAGEIALAPSA